LVLVTLKFKRGSANCASIKVNPDINGTLNPKYQVAPLGTIKTLTVSYNLPSHSLGFGFSLCIKPFTPFADDA